MSLLRLGSRGLNGCLVPPRGNPDPQQNSAAAISPCADSRKLLASPRAPFPRKALLLRLPSQRRPFAMSRKAGEATGRGSIRARNGRREERLRGRGTAEATATQQARALPHSAPHPGFDWDNFAGFGLVPTDFMYTQKCPRGGEWGAGELVLFGDLQLSPSAGVLNYGQGVFEGMKAYRTEDNQLLLFRPDENALRLQQSAERMSMPAPGVEEFVEAVKDTVLANARWVPPAGKGSLYLRPLLFGSGAVLGLAPAPEYTFLIYASPVGNYFSGEVHLKVEEEYHRAAPGGTGAAKTIGNYAPVLKTQLEAKRQGFSDVVYLDAVNNRFIEEVSSCNIFVVKDGSLATPELRGTILPGITRRSIIELAQAMGHTVEERPVAVEELLEADEVFCTGTAVVVSRVQSITFRDQRIDYTTKVPDELAVSSKLFKQLTGIQMGVVEDNMSWAVDL